MKMQLASVLLLLAVSGCATLSERNPETKRTDLMMRAGVKSFTLLELNASLPDELVDIEVTSDLGDVLSELLKNGLNASGGLIGDVIEWAAGMLRLGKG